MFKTANRTVKASPDILSELCIRNDDGILAVCDEDQKTAYKGYHVCMGKEQLDTDLYS